MVGPAQGIRFKTPIWEIKDDHSGHLRLGISVQRSIQILPLVVPIFRQKYPNVVLELTERGSASLEEPLQKGNIDLAFAAMESAGTNIVYELIEQETIGILAASNTGIVSRMHPARPSPWMTLKKNCLFRCAKDIPSALRRTNYSAGPVSILRFYWRQISWKLENGLL